MPPVVAELSSGFAVVGAGAWLFGRAQPAAVRGTLRSRGLKGFICPDRGALSIGELAGGESAAAAHSAAPPPQNPFVLDRIVRSPSCPDPVNARDRHKYSISRARL